MIIGALERALLFTLTNRWKHLGTERPFLAVSRSLNLPISSSLNARFRPMTALE
jgi:hypothetical protein